MTAFQWATLILGTLGFLVTWSVMIAGGARWAAGIKTEVAQAAAAEATARSSAIDALRREFEASQRVQDQNVAEAMFSVRQQVNTFEGKIHEVELYGRDKFALKSDVARMNDALLEEIRAMRSEIKDDLKELSAEIKAAASH